MKQPAGLSTLTRPVVDVGGRGWWSETLASTYCDMAPLWLDGSPAFRAQLRVGALGELALTTVQAHGHSVLRTPAMIADASADDLFLCVVEHGPGEVHQLGRQVRLDAGDFTVIDAGRPYRFDFPQPFTQLVLRIPRARAVERIGDGGLESTLLRHGSGRAGQGAIISDLLRRLARAPLEAEEGARLSAGALDMVLSVISATSDDQLEATRAAHARDRERAMNLFRSRLGDQSLTVGDAAQELAMSTRYLQNLFEEIGSTPSGWLRAARLARARTMLLSGSARVFEVSERCGFKDSAHFSRCFTDAYGVSPGRFRQDLSQGRTVTAESDRLISLR